MCIDKKIERLSDILKGYGKVCIAYSGGTDSDFLLNMAVKTLGNNVIAVMAKGDNVATKDVEDALRLAKNAGAKVFLETVDVFSVSQFRNNTKERCYYCKKNIMQAVIERAGKEGYNLIADGKNADDAKHFRPGAKAAEEIGIVSPLYEAGFTKNEIRQAAQQMGLETWDKPSNSCLATRFMYNTELTKEAFSKVEKAEKFIADKGILSGRVRVHGDIARIEIPHKYFADFINDDSIVSLLKDLGYKYVTLDLEGFRSGSMD